MNACYFPRDFVSNEIWNWEPIWGNVIKWNDNYAIASVEMKWNRHFIFIHSYSNSMGKSLNASTLHAIQWWRFKLWYWTTKCWWISRARVRMSAEIALRTEIRLRRCIINFVLILLHCSMNNLNLKILKWNTDK